MDVSTLLVGVVDDDPRVLESLEELLEAGHYRVLLFSSAETFLEANGFRQVDCLISDIGLPGMSGWDLLQIADTDYPGTPVILITARDDDHAERLSTGTGGTWRLFRKPFDGKLLLAALDEILRPV